MLLRFFVVQFVSILVSIHYVLACPCNVTDPSAPPGGPYCGCELRVIYEAHKCTKIYMCKPWYKHPENGWSCDLDDSWLSPATGCDYAIHPPDTQNNGPNNTNTSSKTCGSVVRIEDQTVQENISILGSELFLNYSSDRVLGRKEYLNYKETMYQPTDPDVTEVFYIHVIDGVPFEQSYGVSSDIEHEFSWNGLNSSSQEVINAVEQKLVVEYEFNNTTREKVLEKNTKLGFYNTRLLGLGGFTISNLHFYSPILEKIFYGDGETKTLPPIKINKTGNVIEKLDIDETSFTHYLVASDDGTKAFIFNLNGYHIETRSTRTSKVLTSFTYDGNNRLTKIEDAFGNETLITRPNSTTVEIETPSGKITTMTLNTDGFATVVKTPNNEQYLMSYSSVPAEKGLMISFQNPKGLISTFTYDSEGRLIEDSNNAGNVVELNVLDEAINYKLIQAISAEGRITEYYANLYESGESDVTKTLPSGAYETRTNWNSSSVVNNPDTSSIGSNKIEDPRFPGQVYTDYERSITTHGNTHYIYNTDTFVYDESDLLYLDEYTQVRALNSKEWETVYDGVTQTYTTTTPLNRIQKVKYNDYDQVIETQYASFSPIQYNYDSYGRLNEIVQNTREWGFTYNTEHEIQSITNPLNQTTSYVYDTNGRVTEVTYPNSEKAYFEYDEIGNIKKIKAGTKPWHEFLYNLFGGLMEYVMPSLSAGNPSVQYQYNDDKQLTKIIRENSDEIDFTYGSTTGLLEKIEALEGDYIYTTDLATEQLTQIKGPLSTTRLEYTYIGDKLQIHRMRDGANNSRYRYDYSNMLVSRYTLGHQDSDSNVSHFVNLTYNNDRLLKKIGDLEITRDNSTGLIEETELGNLTESYTYNANYAETSSYSVKYNTNTIYGQNYTRDALGRMTNATEYNTSAYYNNITYSYDTRGRLVSIARYYPSDRSYFYDENSNRTTVKDQNNKVRQIGTYNSHDQLLTYVIQSDDEITPIYSYTYAYNDFGQRLSKTDSVSNIKEEYEYNSLGALTSYTRTDLSTSAVLKTITYKVDGLGRRLTRSVDGVLQTRYIYDEGIRLVGEVTPDGDTLTHYIYADKMHVPSYMVRDGVTYKFVTNAQGSVRYVVNVSTGVKAQDIIYDEFGIIIDDTNPGFQPFGFAGGIYDPETKLTRFGARDYDAEIGRWTAKDPIGFAGKDTNLYSYSIQDPVNYIDPNGKLGWRLAAFIGCAAYNAYSYWSFYKDMEDLKNKIAENKKKRSECGGDGNGGDNGTAGRGGSGGGNDSNDELDTLNQEYIKLTQELAKKHAESIWGTAGLTAICALIGPRR